MNGKERPEQIRQLKFFGVDAIDGREEQQLQQQAAKKEAGASGKTKKTPR